MTINTLFTNSYWYEQGRKAANEPCCFLIDIDNPDSWMWESHRKEYKRGYQEQQMLNLLGVKNDN